MNNTKNKKLLVTRRADFERMKTMMTKEDFYNKFELSMNIVSEVIAEEAMVNLYFEQERLPNKEEVEQLKKSGLL